MAVGNFMHRFWANFKITDRESCEKAIRNGRNAALVSAAITAFFAVAGLFNKSTNRVLNYFMDPWLIVDVVLLLVLAGFVHRKSRIAASILAAYFVISKVSMWSDLGKVSGFAMAVVFFLFYFTAMRGTYLWHSKFREQSRVVSAQEAIIYEE